LNNLQQTLVGRVAVVTGAGRGIGRAHALQLAARGATVLVNDIGADLEGSGFDAGPAREVASLIDARGGHSEPDFTDVGTLAGGKAVVEQAIKRFGRVDILINNAGIAAGGGGISDPSETGIDRLLGVHFKGALGAMSAAYKDMAGRQWGRIVNTVSEVALDARFGGNGYAYGAAKAAIWSATLAAAREAMPTGVTVNAISPGARTRMNSALLDRGFRGQEPDVDLDPGHVARIVDWLVSDEAAYVTGRILHVAGGKVREYATKRTSQSNLALRIEAALRVA
jgi:NAD(P)-dependent dehydrogenase (short-subunit alcohol dehydrogenase family)